jgi:hypothetical protein
VPSGSPIIGHNLAIALVASGNQGLFNNVQAQTSTGPSCNGVANAGCDLKLTQSTLQ